MSKFYLKDWHGKEKEFADDKIFVRGEDGELIQFTQGDGDKPAVVQPLEVTESGTYTAPDGVDGYSPVTVNVQGGGGGLPAGVYFMTERDSNELKNDRQPFIYNGKRYFVGKTSSSGTNYNLYLFEDGRYTLIKENFNSRGITYYSAVVLNGKVHFFGGDSTGHITWDGENLTSRNTLPDAMAGGQAFVLDGKAYIKTRKSGFYEYDEANNAWTAVAVENCPNTTYECVLLHGRNVYIFGYGNLYKVDWDAKTCVTVATGLPSCSGKNDIVILGDHIYFIAWRSATRHDVLYKYDLNTHTYQEIATFASAPGMYVYNNTIYMCSFDSNVFHMSMHEVTE